MATNYDAHAWNKRHREAALAILTLYGQAGPDRALIANLPVGAEVALATLRAGAMPVRTDAFVPSPGGRQD